MLSVEHEFQAPVDYMDTAGAIGPEHRYFLISWMVMVIITVLAFCMTATLHANKG